MIRDRLRQILGLFVDRVDVPEVCIYLRSGALLLLSAESAQVLCPPGHLPPRQSKSGCGFATFARDPSSLCPLEVRRLIAELGASQRRPFGPRE